VERYYPKLGLDFDLNKRVTDEVAICPSKRMRNKIAGFVTVRLAGVAGHCRVSRPRAGVCVVQLPLRAARCSPIPALPRDSLSPISTQPPFSDAQHLMRRIERGDQVRGISLKLQEEERERRMDFVPDVSAIDTTNITVDPDTRDLLKALDMPFAETVSVQQPARPEHTSGPRGPRRDGGAGRS
jgi:hypothetical protein